MKIVALGGGEIGRPGYPVETISIDKEIIALSGKKTPKVLFVPTASGDSEGYVKVVREHFGTRLSLEVDTLMLCGEKISKKQIEEKVMSADIIYVGGGNTLRMIRIWRKTGTLEIFKKAAKAGKVLSGLSAGAICWFDYGHSDSVRAEKPEKGYIRVSGLGLIPLMFCPHYDIEADRQPSLKAMLKKRGGVALAAENCAAIEILDDSYRVITSKTSARIYKCYWSKGEYRADPIAQASDFRKLSELFDKRPI